MNAENKAPLEKPTMLVTGGAGFIGSHIAEHFLEKYRVVIVDDLSTGDRDNIPSGAIFLEADIGNLLAMLDVFERYKPEVVVHCAAKIDARESMQDPFSYERVNVMGTMSISNLAMGTGAHFINFSSGGCLYGEYTDPKVLPNEKTPIGAIDNVYGLTKWSAEMNLKFLNDSHANFVATTVRPGNVYGPRQCGSKESGIIAIAIERMLRGEVLSVYGDGKQTRDFVYIDDLVKAIDAVVDRCPAGVVNISTGIPVSVLEVIKCIEKEAKQKMETDFRGEKIGDKKHSALEPKVLKDWGVNMSTAIAEGIHLTYKYYEDKLSEED